MFFLQKKNIVTIINENYLTNLVYLQFKKRSEKVVTTKSKFHQPLYHIYHVHMNIFACLFVFMLSTLYILLRKAALGPKADLK